MSLSALIFDMDGTLFDSRTVVPDSYIGAIEEGGGPAYDRDRIVEAYAVGPPAMMMTHLLGRPSTPEDVEAYYRRLLATAHLVAIYPGIREALERLTGQTRRAVYTGASTRACRILLEGSGLLSFFEVAIGADEVARPKPEPDGILEACRRLGVSPATAAYVGDAPYDLQAARSAGVLAVAAGWGHLYQPGETADVVLTHPEDLVPLVLGDARP